MKQMEVTKNKRFNIKILLLAVLFSCFFGINALAGQVNVRFGAVTAQGRFKNSYKEFNVTPARWDWIDLPVVYGNARYYWEGQMSGKTVRFAEGTRHQVTGDVDFYLVRTTACRIFFRSQTGIEYQELNMKVPFSTWFELPSLPDREDLQFQGWSERRGTSERYLPAGKMVQAGGNKIYYALFKRKKKLDNTVYLYFPDGTLFKTLTRTRGTTLLFPSPYLGEKKTLLGWSTRKNQTSAPEYLEDAKIPKRTNVFYMVVCDRTSEPAFSETMLVSPRKYSRIYIMGDSRIAFAQDQFGCMPRNVMFVANPGSGYDWLAGKDPNRDDGAAKRVLQYLKDRKKAGLLKGRYAVISEFGINDLKNASKYVRYYTKLSEKLKKYGCDLYVMSANPIHRGCLEHFLIESTGTNANTRTMPKIREFNRIIREGERKAYRFIDTFSYLQKNGWNSENPWARCGDGLHYSAYTGALMINYAIAAAEACY